MCIFIVVPPIPAKLPSDRPLGHQPFLTQFISTGHHHPDRPTQCQGHLVRAYLLVHINQILLILQRPGQLVVRMKVRVVLHPAIAVVGYFGVHTITHCVAYSTKQYPDIPVAMLQTTFQKNLFFIELEIIIPAGQLTQCIHNRCSTENPVFIDTTIITT